MTAKSRRPSSASKVGIQIGDTLVRGSCQNSTHLLHGGYHCDHGLRSGVRFGILRFPFGFGGKRVKVKLLSGQDLDGKVTKVGTQAVTLSELSGMEFFDATVRLDQVAAVIVRHTK